MKKIVSLLLILVLQSMMFLNSSYAGYSESSDDSYFIVTAYYSPLPNQEYYITGNYQSELRLNGQGIAGASGKSVFSGMLAAPSSYSFGTKIYLQGLGVGSVEDRGGAIVPAGQRGYQHDRIDVWMGYGDEGLRRANYWGKRKVSGYVIGSSNPTTIDYNTVPAPIWANHNLTKNSDFSSSTKAVSLSQADIQEVFTDIINPGDQGEEVKRLQEKLIWLGHLDNVIVTGEYDEDTFDAIINFQLLYSIIESQDTYGAGFFGPQTKRKLNEVLSQKLTQDTGDTTRVTQVKKESTASNTEKVPGSVASLAVEKTRQENTKTFGEELTLAADYANILQGVDKRVKEKMELIGNQEKETSGDNVRTFQEVLTYFGYYNYEITGYHGELTQSALIEYQVARGIISGEEDLAAGYFGPKTKARFRSDLRSNYFYEIVNTREETEKYLSFFHNK